MQPFEQGTDLRPQLEEAWHRARTAWPTVDLPFQRFLSRIRSRCPDRASVRELLEHAVLDDLYLAWACLEGDAAATKVLEEQCEGAVAASLRRLQLSAEKTREAKQRLRVQLFAPERGAPPILENYEGRGRLRSWMGVVAARIAMRMMGSSGREMSLANDVLDALLGPSPSPELDYLKEVYRAEFAQAFRRALGELEPRQRTLLKQRYLDGVEVNQLARLYRTHRATMSRWLSEARVALAERTQAKLAERLAISKSECESVLRLLESRMDVTFSQFG